MVLTNKNKSHIQDSELENDGETHKGEKHPARAHFPWIPEGLSDSFAQPSAVHQVAVEAGSRSDRVKHSIFDR